MSLSIRQTARNLQALCEVVENPQAKNRLTASLWGSGLHIAPLGPSRLISRLRGNQEARVQVIRETTFRSFQAIVHDLETSTDSSRLWEWSQYMKPVLRDRIYPHLMNFEEASGLQESTAVYSRVKRLQRIEDLKQSISIPFPEKVLKKLVKQEKLSYVEEGELARWIERVNEATGLHSLWFRLWRWLWSWLNVSEKKIENGFLHKALEAFSETAKAEEDLSLLEWELDKRGLKAFDWKDPSMVEKRKKWLERKCISHRQEDGSIKTLHLGEQLYPTKPWSQDRRVVYTLPDHPDHVVCIYWNRSLPLLDRHRRERDPYIQENPSDVRLDEELSSPEWGYVVVGRLQLTIDQYEWGEDEECETGSRVIKQLGTLLKDMLDEKYTSSLQAPDLGWLTDQNIQASLLYCVRPIRRESFDFFKWMELLRELAKGKSWVEKKLAEQVGLKNCPEYQFFHELFKHVTEGSQKTTVEILQKFIHDDRILRTPTLKSKGEAFRRLIEMEQGKIISRVREECEVPDDQEDRLKKLMAIVMQQVYEESLSAGTLPQDFFDEVVEKIREMNVFSKRKSV